MRSTISPLCLAVFSLMVVPSLTKAQVAPATQKPQTVPAPATTVAVTPASNPLAGFDILEQIENRLKAVVLQTSTAVVSIEGRTPALMMLPAPRVSGSFLPQNPSRTQIPRSGQYTKTDKEWEQAQQDMMREAANMARIWTGSAPITGSGFLMKGGFVVTTAEVVQRMRDHVVVTSEGRRLKVEWANPCVSSNIAVLKVDGLPSDLGLHWGDSERVAPGSFALTIGNQAGFSHSVSLGFISGTGRAGRSGESRYSNLIQFQGVVAGGGSGGPLLNTRGEVIGMIVATPPSLSENRMRVMINSAHKIDNSETRGGEPPFTAFFDGISNTGFALTSSDMRPIVEVLMKRQQPVVRVGWLGVHLPRPSMDMMHQEPRIVAVYEGGPADHGGLLPGDVVLSINGKPVPSADALREVARNVNAGEAMRFEVKRGENILTLTVTTEVRPEQKQIDKMRLREMSQQTGMLVPIATPSNEPMETKTEILDIIFCVAA